MGGDLFEKLPWWALLALGGFFVWRTLNGIAATQETLRRLPRIEERLERIERALEVSRIEEATPWETTTETTLVGFPFFCCP